MAKRPSFMCAAMRPVAASTVCVTKIASQPTYTTACRWTIAVFSAAPATSGPKYVGQNPTAAIATARSARPMYRRRGAVVRGIAAAVVATIGSGLLRGRRVDVERRARQHLAAVGQEHLARVRDALLILGQ